jgi:hypothetical protein
MALAQGEHRGRLLQGEGGALPEDSCLRQRKFRMGEAQD